MKKMTKIIAVLFIPLIFSGCGAMNQSLHLPAMEGDLQKVRAEIEGGKRVDSKDAAGQTALMYAAQSGRMEVVEYLLSQGANVNAVSGPFGAGAALSYAAISNRLEVMEYLLAKGASVNMVSSRGESALFFAARQGHDEAAKFLLQNRANAKIKNQKDQTALDVAVSNNRGEVAQLLQNYEEQVIKSVAFTGDFSGTYISPTSGAEVNIIQDGNEITGSFGYKGGRIWGDIEGNTIKFDYSYPTGGSGVGKWTFRMGSSEVIGTWKNSTRSKNGEWNLTKIE